MYVEVRKDGVENLENHVLELPLYYSWETLTNDRCSKSTMKRSAKDSIYQEHGLKANASIKFENNKKIESCLYGKRKYMNFIHYFILFFIQLFSKRTS